MTPLISGLIHSGGRKAARARVQLTTGSGKKIIINGKPAELYFQQNPIHLQYISAAYDVVKTQAPYEATIFVEGGGLSAQAQAIRLALSKAFIEMFPNLRPVFKKQSFLIRDARIKERRKYGLKKARKASQFSKR